MTRYRLTTSPFWRAMAWSWTGAMALAVVSAVTVGVTG